MKEISLNILDIAENSVKAGATLTQILLEENGPLLTLSILDDGCGMTPEILRGVVDPFYTTRTTRKVGMGLPLLKLACEQTYDALTGFVADHALAARQIWITPVEKAFSFGPDNVIAFIGDSDRWSDLGKVRRMAERLGVDLSVITGGYDHSLERGSLKSDLKTLETVLTGIEDFVRNYK